MFVLDTCAVSMHTFTDLCSWDLYGFNEDVYECGCIFDMCAYKICLPVRKEKCGLKINIKC